MKEQLDGMKEELQKTEEVEKQVKDVLEKFEGILKASEADNKRLRLEVQEASILREENEALKMFVQKATVMVTSERAKNQELTRLLEDNLIRIPQSGNQALEQSRSTADAMRESLRSRLSADGRLRTSDSGSKYGDDEKINEAPEDQEYEVESSRPSSKQLNSKVPQPQKAESQTNVEIQSAQRNKAPKDIREPTRASVAAVKSPSKTGQSQQKPAASSYTPKVKIADSTDFKLNQAQLKKQFEPRFVRGSDAVDLADFTSPNQETLDQDSDQEGDELYQSGMSGKGMRSTTNRLLSSGNLTAEQEQKMVELLEQNRQLKMMNELLHSSQKQLLQTKQQQLDNSISKVGLGC